MKRAFECQNLDPLGLARIVKMLARHLDGEFACLSPGIGKKHRLGKGVFHKFVRQRLLLRNVVKV